MAQQIVNGYWLYNDGYAGGFRRLANPLADLSNSPAF